MLSYKAIHIGLLLGGLSLVVLGLTFTFSGIFGSSDDLLQLKHINNIYLWTRQSQVVAEDLPVLPGKTLHSTSFSPYRNTYVITHGFLSSALYNWVISLKDALLGHEDCNVLAVSWESGSSRLSYYYVQARVPEVGLEVARVLQLLRDAAGLRLELLHLVGHSLGAHVSGFAAKHFNGSVARITGLDPAGMGFNDADPEDRLDKSDAQFVDVIHTHACTTLIQTYTCYGTTSSIGHVDIWVNGGEEQPACGEGGDGHRVLEDGSPCSHSLSYVYYTESIDHPASSKHYLARSCRTKEHFLNGSCTCAARPQYMGFNVNKRTEGDFYVKTRATWPYGVSDDDCWAAEYTVLQLLGVILLSAVAAVGAVMLCSLAWLHYHPEDQDFFTKEFLLVVVASSVEYCQDAYDRFLEREHVTWLKTILNGSD